MTAFVFQYCWLHEWFVIWPGRFTSILEFFCYYNVWHSWAELHISIFFAHVFGHFRCAQKLVFVLFVCKKVKILYLLYLTDIKHWWIFHNMHIYRTLAWFQLSYMCDSGMDTTRCCRQIHFWRERVCGWDYEGSKQASWWPGTVYIFCFNLFV